MCFLANYLVPVVADLVLKDKIFVYDLANMRMGWADYDCKLKFLSTMAFRPSIPLVRRRD